MKIIYNSLIPFKGYKAINLFGLLFARNDLKKPIDEADIQHEAIHSKQYQEMLWIPFLIWYLTEWIIKIFIYHNLHKAYRNISFEREAYTNENVIGYLENRPHYAWWKYLKEY